MLTQIWKVNEKTPDDNIITLAANVLKRGGLIAFPTETVYGLGANGLDESAVKSIYLAKGRPSDNPLILHIASLGQVFDLCRQVSLAAQVLMEKFWPGPLTLVLPRMSHIPDVATGGLDTVAVRMPDHPVALALIRAAGVPVAAPSANRSGYPSPTQAKHVLDDLGGRIDGIIDAGPTGVGLESTVLDMSGEKPVVLRPGGVTAEQIAAALNQEVYLDPGLANPEIVPKAPGMKYTHYAPRAEVILLEGSTEKIVEKVRELADHYKSGGRKAAFLLTKETWREVGKVPHVYSRDLGSRAQLSEVARNIYAELRASDLAGAEIIVTETYRQEGLGVALMNRLLKSAGYQVLKL